MRPPPFLSSVFIISSPSSTTRTRARGIAWLVERLTPLSVEPPRIVSEHEPADVKARMEQRQSPAEIVCPVTADVQRDPALAAYARSLHVREISNLLKHHAALASISASRRADDVAGPSSRPTEEPRPLFSLVVEDDVVSGDDVSVVLDSIVKAAADAACACGSRDVVFLGLPSRRPQAPADGSVVFDDLASLLGGEVLPGMDSYLVTPEAARWLSSRLLPTCLPTNAQFTVLLRSLTSSEGVGGRARVAVPNAFVDGSKAGIYTSSINPNNKLIWSLPYCRLETWLRTPREHRGGEGEDFFERHLAEQPESFRRHPDVQVLLGDFLVECGRVGEGRAAYDRALLAYEADGAVVNTRSEFLKRYMATYAPPRT